MEQNIQKLFKQASYQPESRLSGDVLCFIESKSSRRIKLKRLVYLSASALSLSGSVISIVSLIDKLGRAGFYDYFSLAFSDSGVVASYWKEYILTIADSLPVVSIILSFSLLFILFIYVYD